MIPQSAPEEPENWQDVMSDIERVIMPGLTHWQHPQFHGFFPFTNSYPGIVAELLQTGLGCVASMWAACPVATELEMVNSREIIQKTFQS